MAQAVDRAGTGSATITLQETPPSPPPATVVAPSAPQVLTLRLAPRRKKTVSWQDGTVDNEFLNRRSSKKCCIFHKEKPFDEDSSDAEDEHDDDCAHAKGKEACDDSQNPGGAEGPSFTDCTSHNHCGFRRRWAHPPSAGSQFYSAGLYFPSYELVMYDMDNLCTSIIIQVGSSLGFLAKKFLISLKGLACVLFVGIRWLLSTRLTFNICFLFVAAENILLATVYMSQLCSESLFCKGVAYVMIGITITGINCLKSLLKLHRASTIVTFVPLEGYAQPKHR
ncbi:hypothetical protein GOP47_0012141 [Adiantum capillus-veneris]|uniref:Uncharacterized protein n=1 Tax=Adiantum capillus-veneris TaxID=13818 RepID=A0A9D4UQG2_ADICA|nr:hypothetical protein GOP47_0012141 [Adiantum capillus-veneris]